MRARFRLGRSASGASLLALVLLAGACSDPAYEYVRNTSVNTVFKVPADWATFDEATYRGREAQQGDPTEWLVGIDGDPRPSVDHVLDPAADHPAGIAIVQSLSFEDRDVSSFAELRNIFFPVDYMLRNLPNDVAIVSYDDQMAREDTRGVHLVAQFNTSVLGDAQEAASREKVVKGAGVPPEIELGALGASSGLRIDPGWATVNQIAFLDEATEHAYVLTIVCNSVCYDKNQADIESAIDSWTVIP